MSQYDSLPEGVTRDTMEADVVIIGGGAAGLSAAYQFAKKVEEHNAALAAGKIQGQPIPEQMILVLEKGSEIGAHSFSGAVLNPKALAELIPDFKAQGAPLATEVKEDAVY